MDGSVPSIHLLTTRSSVAYLVPPLSYWFRLLERTHRNGKILFSNGNEGSSFRTWPASGRTESLLRN